MDNFVMPRAVVVNEVDSEVAETQEFDIEASNACSCLRFTRQSKASTY